MAREKQSAGDPNLVPSIAEFTRKPRIGSRSAAPRSLRGRDVVGGRVHRLKFASRRRGSGWAVDAAPATSSLPTQSTPSCPPRVPDCLAPWVLDVIDDMAENDPQALQALIDRLEREWGMQ